MKSKKGITPVIAVILLLMMTVAAAGAAFFWFVRIQGELQGGTEQYAESLGETVASSVEVIRAEYRQLYHGAPINSLVPHGNLTMIIKNTGNARIPLEAGSTAPTITWILSDEDQNMICNSDWNADPTNCESGCGGYLTPNEVQKVVLNLTNECSIGLNGSNSSSADLYQPTAFYTNGTMFYYQIDFSGQAATGGSFTK